MSYQDAIAGFGQLHQAFRENADRKQRQAMLLQEQLFRSEEAKKQREFQAAEGTKERALGWSKFGLEKKEYERKVAGAEEVSGLIGPGLEGETPEGKALKAGVKAGLITPEKAMEKFADPDQMMFYMTKFMAKPDAIKDPAMMESYNNALDLYDTYKQQEAKDLDMKASIAAKIKKGSTPIKYKLDVASQYGWLKDTLKEQYDYDMDDEGGDAAQPMVKFIQDVKSWKKEIGELDNDNVKDYVKKVELTTGAALKDNILRNNPTMPVEYADYFSRALINKVMFGGGNSLKKLESVGEKGESKRYKIAPLEIDMPSHDYMQTTRGSAYSEKAKTRSAEGSAVAGDFDAIIDEAIQEKEKTPE